MISNRKNEKIMILGAGPGQLPAILKAKEKNLYVIAVDRNPNAIGLKFADQALLIDTVSTEKVLSAAQDLNINGTMTMQSDVAVPTVGALVSHLNLTGPDYECAKNCSNKIETRKIFKKNRVPQPDFYVASELDEVIDAADKLGFPCIVKAPDSSGSRGVVKVNSKNEIESAFNEAKEFSNNGFLLIEEYINGIEIGAQTFSLRGECIEVMVHNDTLSEPPYMIPIGHSFPSRLTGLQLQKIEEAVKKAVKALNIKNGPANIDIILDDENNPKIIEVGARIGATCLPELIYYHSGVDWVSAAIDIAIGNEPSLIKTHENPVSALILESPMDGVISDIFVPDYIKDLDHLLEIEITSKIGDKVSKLRKGTDRIGKVITSGNTLDQSEELAHKIKNSIEFKVL